MATGRKAASLLLTLVALAACSGGDDGGGGNQVTGPDDAGAHTAASIVVVSGANQAASAGQAVPTAPIVRVMSERGRPLRGATLTATPEGGRGALDPATVVTNDAGEATLPRWVAPLTAGEFAVMVAAQGAGGASVTARVTASVKDEEQVLATQSIGPAGGTVTVASTTSALNGLTITVKPGAYATVATFTISSAPAPTLPAGLTVASPVVGIDGPVTKSDSASTIRLPVTVAGSGIASAYMLADDNSLIPMPTQSSDANSVTVLLRQFVTPANTPAATDSRAIAGNASMRPLVRVVMARWAPPATGVFPTGFTITVNNIEAVNNGSYWESGGFCAGSSVLNGDWFRRGSVAARLQFPGLLTRAETNNWGAVDQLNPAIRLATALQGSYGPNAWTVGYLKVLFGQSHKSVWDNVVRSIMRHRLPVYLAIRSTAGGHAIVAYKVDLSLERIYVADPNFPEDANRFIQYHANTQRLDSFPSAQNAASSASLYTEFADATWFFREDSPTITTTTNQYLADGLRSRYAPVFGTILLKSLRVVTATENVNFVAVESRDRELRFVANGLGTGALAWVRVVAGTAATNGLKSVFSNTDTLKVDLASGLNKIGIVINKADASGQFAWYDAKVLQITRAQPAIKFLTPPANSSINRSLGPVRIGLVDEDGVLVPEQRPITLTLTGGAAGAVLAGASNVTTGADGSVTLSNLTVDKVGTGYTLSASSNLLTTVSSASFNINDGGSFTGRVFDAVTTNGLDGVTITVRGADGNVASTGTSAGGGNWTVSGLPAGAYSIFATRTGYVSTALAAQTLTLPSTTVEPIPLVPNNTPGGISGTIRNASTTNLITSAVTVELRTGLNNMTSATTASVTTSSGSYTFVNVPAGAYTIVARATGFTDGSRTGIVVGAGNTVTQQDVLMSPSAGAARIVLTWGASPSDLDSHFTGPTVGSSTRFWVYYSSRGNCAASPFTCLDVDDVSAFGPETITLGQITAGVYRYYVYDYTNRNNTASTALGTSGARVQFYVGNTLRQTFFVPGGVGNAWAVFEWDGQTLTAPNRLYTITGVPQPALMAEPRGVLAMDEELRQLLSRLPDKTPQ